MPVRLFSGRPAEKGSILTVLLLAVGMVGTLGVVMYQLVSGPLSSMVRVMNNTTTKTQIHSVASIVIMDAVNPGVGDCDFDGSIEPRAWRAATGGAGTFPAGAGLIPLTIGAPVTDSWGTDYGYCVCRVPRAAADRRGSAGSAR